MLTDFNKFVNNLTLDDYNSIAGENWPSYEQLKLGVNVPRFVLDELEPLFKTSGEVQQKIKNFCVMPFYGFDQRYKQSCCLMTRFDTIERIKQDMLSGKRPPECQYCWRNEDYGLVSERIVKNRTFDFYSKKDISVTFAECESKLNSIQLHKIYTSNTCNAACVTCDGNSSSLWINYEKQNNIHSHNTWQIKSVDEFDIDYPRALTIEFVGGEPTLSKTNFKILERLIDCGNTDCLISITTNGAFNFSAYQLQLLRSFSHVDFCFSVDGIGKVFEYMRYPLSWAKLLSNIKLCRDNNFMVNIIYTLSNVNITYYNETVEWFESNGFEYLINPVNFPLWFSPRALPWEIKTHLINQNSRASKFLELHTVDDDRNFESMKREIAKQDLWKGISVADYLPEFAALIK